MARLGRAAAILAILTLASLGGCPGGPALNWPPVTIADATAPWVTPGTPRVLDAIVTVPVSGWTIIRVEARHTRHFWPGVPAANSTLATMIGDTLSPDGLTRIQTWRATPAGAAGFPTADRQFWQWFVDFRLDDGQDVVTSADPADGAAPRSMVVGCTGGQIAASLAAVNATLAAFAPATGQLTDNPTHLVPAHFLPVSLAGQGVPFGGQNPAVLPGTLAINNPSLLLYAPRAQRAGETNAAFLAAITDILPDPPYRLLGVAYAAPHASGTRRPSLGCIPSDEWFVHEAGWHTPNGGFVPTPAPETVLGETAVLLPIPPATPAVCTPIPVLVTCPAGSVPVGSIFHPRLWDLHAWAVGGGAAPPARTLAVPGGQAGLAVPGNAFFRPQTFE